MFTLSPNHNLQHKTPGPDPFSNLSTNKYSSECYSLLNKIFNVEKEPSQSLGIV